MSEDFLKSEDIMKKFAISKETLFNWRKQNKFPKPIKIGRRNLWKKEDIDNYINSLSSKQNDAWHKS